MNSNAVTLVLTGASIMGFWVVGLFFWHYWKLTHERLFALFACGFWVMGLERTVLLGLNPQNEFTPYVYFLRLAAFGLILIGIIDQNRKG